MRIDALCKISVVVPVYNGGEMLTTCLRAINNQQGIDRATIEIIVVDDASTDSGAKKAEMLCDQMIILQNNSGAATARNTGARAASGDIIVFVDSDVILGHYSLSKFLTVFEKDDLVAAAVGCYSEKPADVKFLNIYHNTFTRYHHDQSLKEIDWFWGAISAVRKEAFFQAGGFDERYQGASGEDLSLGRMLFDGGYKTVYVPEAQGAHAHQFTISNMLKNDYLKAVTGMKMMLSNIMPVQAPGFVNLRSIMTSFLLVLYPVLLLLHYALHVPHFIKVSVVIFLTLIIINRRYYACVSKLLDFRVSFLLPFLHWIQMYAMIAGAIMGALGYLLGRTAFGRPKWI